MTRKQIRQAVLDLQIQENKMRLSLDKRIKKLRLKIVDIRKQCKHPKTTYWSYPSGNSDNYMSCDDCGEERTRF